MLSEAKHLGGEWNQPLFSCLAQILRWRSELALSVAEGMTGGTTRTPQNVVAHGARRLNMGLVLAEMYAYTVRFVNARVWWLSSGNT
jgi:hypothetical protein